VLAFVLYWWVSPVLRRGKWSSGLVKEEAIVVEQLGVMALAASTFFNIAVVQLILPPLSHYPCNDSWVAAVPLWNEHCVS
jgi:hypothetical protein